MIQPNIMIVIEIKLGDNLIQMMIGIRLQMKKNYYWVQILLMGIAMEIGGMILKIKCH